MRDEIQEEQDRLARGVEAARVYIDERRYVLVAVLVVLAVAEVVAVVALDGLLMKAATAAVVAQLVALFLYITSAGDGGSL